MAFVEGAWKLKSAAEADIERFEDGSAMSLRIQEWLATPEGTLAHYPSWGHNLSQFKHDPLAADCDLAVQIELALTRKLPRDIDDLRLIGVHVDVLEFDLARITIVHQYGRENQQVKL